MSSHELLKCLWCQFETPEIDLLYLHIEVQHEDFAPTLSKDLQIKTDLDPSEDMEEEEGATDDDTEESSQEEISNMDTTGDKLNTAARDTSTSKDSSGKGSLDTTVVASSTPKLCLSPHYTPPEASDSLLLAVVKPSAASDTAAPSAVTSQADNSNEAEPSKNQTGTESLESTDGESISDDLVVAAAVADVVDCVQDTDTSSGVSMETDSAVSPPVTVETSPEYEKSKYSMVHTPVKLAEVSADVLEDTNVQVEGVNNTVRTSFKEENEQSPEVVSSEKLADAYVCHVCDQEFKSKISAIRHVQHQHARDFPFICQICSERFSTFSQVHWHCVKKHNRKKPLFQIDHECKVRLKKYSEANIKTKKVVIKLEPSKVPLREKRVSKRPEQFTNDDSSQMEHQFFCSRCLYSACRVYNVRRHVLKNHIKLRPNSCGVCKNKFLFMDDLKKHIRDRHLHQPVQMETDADCVKAMAQQVSQMIVGPDRQPVDEGSDYSFISQLLLKGSGGSAISDDSLASPNVSLFDDCSMLDASSSSFSEESSSSTHAKSSSSSFRTSSAALSPPLLPPPALSATEERATPQRSANLPSVAGGASSSTDIDQAKLLAWRQHGFRYQCKMCNLMVKGFSSIERHIAISHTDYKPITCLTCKKSFSIMGDYSSHCTKSHDGDLSQHNINYDQIHKINLEIERLTDNLDFKLKSSQQMTKYVTCPECGVKQQDSMCLRYHILNVHITDWPFECDVCHLKFKSIGLMSSHFIHHHKGRTTSFSTDEQQLVSLNEIFGRIFGLDEAAAELNDPTSSDTSFTSGLESTSKRRSSSSGNLMSYKFKCSLCGQVATDRCSLEKHISKIHAKILPYTCGYCGEKFSHHNYLYVHSNKEHPSQPLQRILDPDANFKLQQFLEANIVSTGADSKGKFRCKVCGYRRSTINALHFHAVTHFDVWPFACGICHRKFKVYATLNSHTNGYHKGEKVVCVKDDEAFNKLNHLITENMDFQSNA